jgi:hypothetical protein
MTTDEIVKTDKQYRKRLFNIYLIGIAAVIALWHWGKPMLINHIQQLPIKTQVETVEILSHFFLLLFIPAAIYLITIGRRVCRFKAMPYPGMKVIRDTVIVRGEKALRRGKSMVVLGTALIILVAISIISTHVIMLKFKHHPLFSPVFYGAEN